MKTEASDIVKLLRMLADEQGDHTCGQLHALAQRGEPILDICHEAIRILASEKAHYQKFALDLVNAQPPGPIIITKDKPLA